MKKITISILLVLFLCSCGFHTLSSDLSTVYCSSSTSSTLTDQQHNSETEDSGNKEFPIKTYRSYEVYDANTINNEFDQAMIQNPIDQKMNEELKSVDISGTRESQIFYDSFVEIWKKELIFSIENLKEYLSSEETEKLETAQACWEENWKSNSDFDLYLIGEKGIDLGTQYATSGLIYLINQYRDRVFHIKYMTMLVEEYVDNSIPSNQVLWKKFQLIE